MSHKPQLSLDLPLGMTDELQKKEQLAAVIPIRIAVKKP